jgi:hypothetical protein
MATIYLPVAASDVMGIASDWNTEAMQAGKPGFTIITNTATGFVKAGRRMIGRGRLALVPSTEKLYVMIHGDGNDQANTYAVAGQRADGDWKSYDPQHLARHLEKEGLSKAHRDLRLAACNGGRVDAVGYSFASVLKAWLSHRGYQNLTVYAYNGEILNIRMQFSDGSWHKITDLGGSAGEVRLASARVAY